MVAYAYGHSFLILIGLLPLFSAVSFVIHRVSVSIQYSLQKSLKAQRMIGVLNGNSGAHEGALIAQS